VPKKHNKLYKESRGYGAMYQKETGARNRTERLDKDIKCNVKRGGRKKSAIKLSGSKRGSHDGMGLRTGAFGRKKRKG